MLWLFLPWLAFAEPPDAATRDPVAVELPAADQQAIRRLIDDQIGSFQRRDAEGAWRHVSPTLQGQFGSPERFMEMVREGYAPLYTPRSVSFDELIPVPGGWGQWMEVVGPDGERVKALYLLERQADGSWRTMGCLMSEPVRGVPAS